MEQHGHRDAKKKKILYLMWTSRLYVSLDEKLARNATYLRVLPRYPQFQLEFPKDLLCLPFYNTMMSDSIIQEGFRMESIGNLEGAKEAYMTSKNTKKNADAIARLAWLHRDSLDIYYKLIHEAVSQQSAVGYYLWAHILIGQGLEEKDPKNKYVTIVKGLRFCQKSALVGYSAAQTLYGICCHLGIAMSLNVSEAHKCYLMASSRELHDDNKAVDPRGQFLLGFTYEKGGRCARKQGDGSFVV